MAVALSASFIAISGCRSRLSHQQAAVAPQSSACSSQTLTPEALFEGAKPAVAVVRSGSMQGSAFVVRQTGSTTILITNAHVVGSSPRVSIKWSDGSQDSGTVIANAGASTPQADLALIEVKRLRGRALLLKGVAPNVGADVVAIGAPQGLEFSLTRGVVSSLRDDGRILQIDAPINPGNSGGPVLDKSGCVVGMATFKLEDSEGLNFAVSSVLIDSYLRGLPSPALGAPSPGSSFVPPTPPFSRATPPARPNSPPSLGGSVNCWFQTEPGSQRLDASLCQITSRNASQGRLEIQLIDAGGSRRVIYLRPDKTVDVYFGGQRFDGTWIEDEDGDVVVDVDSGVFAFRPPS